MFHLVHIDLFPNIFEYLSQKELLDILLINKLFYQQVMKYITNTFFYKPIQTVEMSSGFNEACENNLIISILQLGKIHYPYNAIQSACKGGHLYLVKMFFTKYNSELKDRFQLKKYWNCAFINACFSGNIDIINIFIEKGIKRWNVGLQGACRGGHQHIIDLMIEKGAFKWNRGLLGACIGGHLPIMHDMIRRGADNWNWAIDGAMGCANQEIGLSIIKFVQSKNIPINDYGKACFYANVIAFKYFLSIKTQSLDIDLLNYCLRNLCYNHRGYTPNVRELIKIVIDLGATSCLCGKSIDEHRKK